MGLPTPAGRFEGNAERRDHERQPETVSRSGRVREPHPREEGRRARARTGGAGGRPTLLVALRATVAGDEGGGSERREVDHDRRRIPRGAPPSRPADAPPPGRMTPGHWRPEDPGAVAIALDTLVAGVHFRPDDAPRAVGHKALAVNLSDLAAMGACPRRALAHVAHPARPSPTASEWEREFAAGLEALAARFGVRVHRLPGRRGPLLAAVEAAGTFPDPRPPLRRAGARPGDAIYVTGALGDAAGALLGRTSHPASDPAPALAARLDRPEPRVAAGLALRGIASSAIDVSDGLCADLGHVLATSRAGARLDTARLPLSPALLAAFGRERATDLALAGGDDYELVFTVPPAHEPRLANAPLGVRISRIGVIEHEPGLRCFGRNGEPRPVPRGYEHFEAYAGETAGRPW